MRPATVAVMLLTVLLAPAVAIADEASEARAIVKAATSQSVTVGRVLAAAPGGGFNTCEGSRATPQCVQALRQGAGVESTTATSPPAAGTTTSTAAPTPGNTSATVPAKAPSMPRPTGTGWAVGAMAGSVGAALGVGAQAEEERRREAEFQRAMRESARTLEEVKRQQAREAAAAPGALKVDLPTRAPVTPIREPSGKVAPRAESEEHGPLGAPGAAGDRVMEEPEPEGQSPLDLSNPYGQHGKPDHQATVKRLQERAKAEFPYAEINTGTSVLSRTGINRRPDVWVRDKKTDRVLKVYEAARFNPDGSLTKREQLKKDEYDRAGIPNHFEPVIP